MFEHTFRNIDDILRKDAGCSSETRKLAALDEIKRSLRHQAFSGQL